MCGIAGFYGFRDDSLIKKFSEQLYHRGPDGEGYYIDDKVSLLNRRLAIIDRKGGDQPIYNEDKTIVVTYNGEIYNYRELRLELENLGHKFRTKSDTEVIVHGYEQWGDPCFDRFNGMFGVALYDKKQNKLILTRDHFGIKPLYYAFLGRDVINHVSTNDIKIIFSSEIKPIINSGLVKKKPNDRIIYRYLRYRIHDDQRETFFDDIYRLLPGEMLIVQISRFAKQAKFKIRKYTSLKEELVELPSHSGERKRHQNRFWTSQNDTESIRKFKEKLIEAIRLRLISEVPVGTCLSGGLDSSTVVSVVNKLLKEKVREAESVGKIQNTFSAVFPGGSNDEERYVDKLKTQMSNVKIHKVYPKPEEFFKEMEDFIRTQEEPTISTGPYAQYKVMQEAHKYVTVLLDGQGADEMLAGYLPYYFVYLRQLIKRKKYLKLIREIKGSLDIISGYTMNRFIGVVGLRRSVLMDDLLNKNFIKKFSKERFESTEDDLKKRLIEDIFSNSLQSLLRYEDKNAMRFSIEGRVPFLDFNLLRFLFSLPDEAIIKDGWNKNILREAIKDLTPNQIRLRRNKIGFTTPEYEWFIRMKNKIYSIFLSESFAKRKYFNQQEVLNAFQKFIDGKNDDTMLFWRLMNVEMWMRVFIDKKPVNVLAGSRVNEFGPNEGKKLEIKVEGKKYVRFPIRTELFKKGDDMAGKIAKLLNGYLVKNSKGVLNQVQDNPQINVNAGWFLVVSEKIVAIAQGRSFFIWDIKTGFWANLLSSFVKKTPYGIGLGSSWTMQLAISDVGLTRIILAAVVGKMGQFLGMKGLFYKIAGNNINAIDGPTEYSLYPSNVSAKLGPKEPQKVTEGIHNEIVGRWKLEVGSERTSNVKPQTSNFLGVVIIDANDLGQRVLGNSTQIDNKIIEKIFSDNPMGQADEQTPLILTFVK